MTQRLKDELKKRRINQQIIALRTNYNQSTISKMLSGLTPLKPWVEYEIKKAIAEHDVIS